MSNLEILKKNQQLPASIAASFPGEGGGSQCFYVCAGGGCGTSGGALSGHSRWGWRAGRPPGWTAWRSERRGAGSDGLPAAAPAGTTQRRGSGPACRRPSCRGRPEAWAERWPWPPAPRRSLPSTPLSGTSEDMNHQGWECSIRSRFRGLRFN